MIGRRISVRSSPSGRRAGSLRRRRSRRYLTAPFYAPSIDLARVSELLPVPTTSIYTSEDGIIAWESCRDERPGVVAIDIGGTHFGLGRNPRALRATAKRLQAARREAIRGGLRRIP